VDLINDRGHDHGGNRLVFVILPGAQSIPSASREEVIRHVLALLIGCAVTFHVATEMTFRLARAKKLLALAHTAE
jgi:hypothetical protein